MKTALPDDIDLLKGMLAKHQMMLKQQQVQLRTYAGQVAGYEQEIERLKAQLDKLKRMLSGQSSEKLRNKLEKIREAEKRLGDIEDLLNNAKGCLEAAAAVTVESDVDVVPEKPTEKPTSPRLPSSSKPLPVELPRETVRIEPRETVCPVCRG